MSVCGWAGGLRMREATGPSWRWGWWGGVEGRPALSARLRTVLAPTEVGGISELTEACDWWSFGSLLYELLTGTVSSVWAGCGAWLVSLSIEWAGVSPTGQSWGLSLPDRSIPGHWAQCLVSTGPLSPSPEAVREGGSNSHQGLGHTLHPDPRQASGDSLGDCQLR